jgi:hypothetical protein
VKGIRDMSENNKTDNLHTSDEDIQVLTEEKAEETVSEETTAEETTQEETAAEEQDGVSSVFGKGSENNLGGAEYVVTFGAAQ